MSFSGRILFQSSTVFDRKKDASSMTVSQTRVCVMSLEESFFNPAPCLTVKKDASSMAAFSLEDL